MGYVLYWRPGTASMAPHAALAEIGADYRLIEIGREEAQSDAKYRALNPLGVVPTLLDEASGLVLPESAAILLYLGDRYPDSQLAPAQSSSDGRADYFRWLVFLTNTVQTTMLRWFYPDRYGDADTVAAAAARDAAEVFDILDRALAGREWLAADHRTGADLFLFMLTRWGRRLDPPAWDRPNLRRHFLATLELPGVQRMISEQGLEITPL
jgi:glutathione S-transferase